jgi:hypothetical protein
MNLDKQIGIWIEIVGNDDPIDVKIAEIADAARESTAHHAAMSRARALVRPLIVDPGAAGKALGPLAQIVDAAIAEEAAEITPTERIAAPLVNLVNLVDLIECSHGPVSDTSRSTIRSWLPRMEVSRDDEDTSYYWTTGFAALALGDRQTATRFAPQQPFAAGATFQFNLQGLLAHLGGAIDAKAKLDDVLPAWNDLVASYIPLSQASNVDAGTLLWIARNVFHVIGGAPVATVASRLHDSLWTAAGRKP